MKKLKIYDKTLHLENCEFDSSQKREKWKLKQGGDNFKYYFYENKDGKNLTISGLREKIKHPTNRVIGETYYFLDASNFENGFAFVGAGRVWDEGNGKLTTTNVCIDIYHIINDKGELLFSMNMKPTRIGNVFMGESNAFGFVAYDANTNNAYALESKELESLMDISKRTLKRMDKEGRVLSI